MARALTAEESRRVHGLDERVAVQTLIASTARPNRVATCRTGMSPIGRDGPGTASSRLSSSSGPTQSSQKASTPATA